MYEKEARKVDDIFVDLRKMLSILSQVSHSSFLFRLFNSKSRKIPRYLLPRSEVIIYPVLFISQIYILQEFSWCFKQSINANKIYSSISREENWLLNDPDINPEYAVVLNRGMSQGTMEAVQEQFYVACAWLHFFMFNFCCKGLSLQKQEIWCCGKIVLVFKYYINSLNSLFEVLLLVAVS